MTSTDLFLFKLFCDAVTPLMTNEGFPHQSRIKVTAQRKTGKKIISHHLGSQRLFLNSVPNKRIRPHT